MTHTYAPGDRVRVALYGPNGAPTNRIATVTRADPDAVRVVLGDGVALVVGPDALTPLPPATRKRSRPGQGRPTTRWLLHTGDKFAVALAAATGESTPLVGYTVTEVDATAGRVTLTAATGERIVMLGETQEATHGNGND